MTPNEMELLNKRVLSGDRDSILEGFLRGGCVTRTNAIIESVKHGYRDKPIIQQIRRLTTDTTGSFGNEYWRIWHFALAALDLLGRIRCGRCRL